MMQLLAKSWMPEIPTTEKDLNAQLKQFECYWCEGRIWICELGWLPMLSSLGRASAFLSLPPLKELLCLLRMDAGSHWGNPSWGSYLTQNRGVWSELSETPTSCWCSNTPPPVYLGAFALATAAAVFPQVSERLAPPLRSCVCSNVTLYSWGLPWSKNPSLHTPFVLYFTFLYSNFIIWRAEYYLLICILPISLTWVPCVWSLEPGT